MLDISKCTFEEKYSDKEYGTVYYFIYPKDGMDETEFYSEEDYGNVVFTCISLTVSDDGDYYMQMSPTVEEDNCFSDVDWRDLFPSVNYDESIVFELRKIANKEEN